MPDKRPPAGLGAEFETEPRGIDPSPLTTQLVWREIAALKELMMSRLEAIETSIRVAHEDLVRVPTDVMKQVGTLRDLHEAKLASVQKEVDRNIADIDGLEKGVTQLRESTGIDVSRIDALLKTHKEAVERGLVAAKEAVDEHNKASAMAISKSESAINKQIESLITLSGSTASAIESKVSDLKDRQTAIESKVEGVKEYRGESRNAGQYAFTIAGFILGALGLVVGWIISQKGLT